MANKIIIIIINVTSDPHQHITKKINLSILTKEKNIIKKKW